MLPRTRRLIGPPEACPIRGQVSPPAWVCFYEVNPLREQREYAVREAAERERAAWSAFERAARPDAVDEATLHAFRDHWRTASRSLVEALRALKG
jgi:hypothetical protein